MHDDDVTTGPSWERRIVSVVVLVVGAALLFLIGSAVIPRWWAHRVGRVVDGSLTMGALFGFFLGFVFTVLPLCLLFAVIRFRRETRTWKGWIGWLLLVLLAAAPNLMTLGIVWGRGSAAHDGERTLAVDGPGFRLWTLIGAIVGVVAVLGLGYVMRTRGWFKDQNRRMRNELADRDPPPSAAP